MTNSLFEPLLGAVTALKTKVSHPD